MANFFVPPVSKSGFSPRAPSSSTKVPYGSRFVYVFEGVKKSVYYTGKVVSNIAFEIITSPLCIGIGTGITNLTTNVFVIEPIIDFLTEAAGEVLDPENIEAYITYIYENPEEVIFTGPILEEMIFRGFVQGTVKWFAVRTLPDVNLSLFGKQVKLASAVAIAVSAVLFGVVHYSNGVGIGQVILCTTSGVLYGALNERFGIVVPTLAHMTNNGIVWIFMFLSV